MIQILALYALLASSFIFGKVLLSYLDPLFLVGIRKIIAGIIFLGYLLYVHRKALKSHSKSLFSSMAISYSDLFAFMQIILFHIFFAFVPEFWALQFMDSSKAALFYNFAPFITAFIAWIFFKETLTARQLVGLLCGFIGLIPLFWLQDSIKIQSIASSIISLPEIAMILSVISAAYGWIAFQSMVTQKHYSPSTLNGVGMFGGGILSLLVSLLMEGAPHIHRPETTFWLDRLITSAMGPMGSFLVIAIYLMLLIFTASIIFYNWYGYLLKSYSASFLSFCGFTTPLFAALFDWVLWGQTVGILFFLSLFLVAIGLWLFYGDERKKRTTKQYGGSH